MIQRYNDECSLVTNGETPYVSFTAFEKYDFVNAGFSPRLGGVSKAHTWSLNLGFNLEESRENVLENYRRISGAIGFEPESLVLTKQEHETNVLEVEERDRGKGIFADRDYDSVDGMITDKPGVALTVFGADCVPLIFLDPVKRVIATAHAGWRGTVNNIAGIVVDKFVNVYGSNPRDIIVEICPSICADCYEIGPDVAGEFEKKYADAYCRKYDVPLEYKTDTILRNGEGDRSYLNLWLANYVNLIEKEIKPENIHLCGLCSMCRQDLFFSHRGSHGRRGVMGGFIVLK